MRSPPAFVSLALAGLPCLVRGRIARGLPVAAAANGVLRSLAIAGSEVEL